MLRLALACLLSLFAAEPLLAKTVTLKAEPAGQVIFQTPSNNIECIFTPKGGVPHYQTQDGLAELSCDRVEPNYVNVLLGAQRPGQLTLNPDEQPCCALTQVLDYGNQVVLGPFTCDSGKSGLRCTRKDGMGIVISREVTGVFTGKAP